MLHPRTVVLAALAIAGVACVPAAQLRFPPEVAAAFAGQPTRRIETAHLVIYYPAARAAQVRRFAAHAEACLTALRAAAVIHDGPAADKLVIAMPEVELDNAYVAPPDAGLPPIAVIPTAYTLDFTTELGLPPDPRFVGCHELVHAVHQAQITGTWRVLDAVFGDVTTPQLGFDAWLFEGLASHYEAALQPGVGRPRWPVFTGMFAAGFAGRTVTGGELSELGRRATVGHHYLVGALFVEYLAETYGERALWLAIADQAASTSIVLDVAGSFAAAYGMSLGDLIDGFARWAAARFPTRPRPAAQAVVRAQLGADARYARGADGTEAWIAADQDHPAHLVVRNPDGATAADIALADLAPPRRLAIADPTLTSGLSITADGREVWFTAVDLAATSTTTRLLRWRRGDGVREVASGLGPGATIAPDGGTYYYLDVDGDRWRPARWDVARRRRAGFVHHVAPGAYVLAAAISPDGARLCESVWDGARFALWVVDARTGARLAELADPAGPVYDGGFLPDGRVVYLGVVAGRFQVRVHGEDGGDAVVTDAPYAALAPRGGPDGTIRFLDREGWGWDLAQVVPPAGAAAVPATATATATATPAPASGPAAAPATPPVPALPASAVRGDRGYSHLDHLFVPTLRAPSLAVLGPGVPLAGLVLAGGDRLGFHRWSLAGYAQLGIEHQPTVASGAASYVDATAAPWLVLADAAWFRWNQREADADPASDAYVYRARRTRDASATLGRTWRDAVAVAVTASIHDDHDQLAGEPATDARLGGATIGAAYDAVVPTLYGGASRRLGARAAIGAFPRALGTFRGDLADVALAAHGAAPVPGTTRLIATARLRAHAAFARDPRDADLLAIGGGFLVTPLYQHASVAVPAALDDLRFPPGLRFGEVVRGFEDLELSTDRAGLADLALRYPLVIDRGIARTWFLPASFVRQIDLEGFAAGWLDVDPDHARRGHVAFGGAVVLRLALFRIPLAIEYQLARRVTDDRALVQLIGVGPD